MSQQQQQDYDDTEKQLGHSELQFVQKRDVEEGKDDADGEDECSEEEEEDDDEESFVCESDEDETIDRRIEDVMAKLRGFLRTTREVEESSSSSSSFRRDLLDALETVDYLCLVHPKAENNIDKFNQAGASSLLSKLLVKHEGDDNMLHLIAQSIASLCGRSGIYA